MDLEREDVSEIADRMTISGDALAGPDGLAAGGEPSGWLLSASHHRIAQLFRVGFTLSRLYALLASTGRNSSGWDWLRRRGSIDLRHSWVRRARYATGLRDSSVVAARVAHFQGAPRPRRARRRMADAIRRMANGRPSMR